MSIKSVASIVRACGFAYRRLRRRQVSSRPAAASQEMDIAFRETFTRAMGEGRCIIAFDESGFDHRVVPLYGYAPRGSPAVGKYAALTDNKRHIHMACFTTSEPGRRRVLKNARGDGVRVIGRLFGHIGFAALACGQGRLASARLPSCFYYTL